MKEKVFLSNLTGLRFFLALWVILYHLNPFDLYIFKRGYLAVDFFFILSGFILAHVYWGSFFENKFSFKDYKQFLLKRFFRIFPVHIFTFVCSVFIILFGRYIIQSNYYVINLNSIIPNILMIHSWNLGSKYGTGWNVFSWSVSIEWFAYLIIFPGIAYIYLNSGVKYLIFIVLISFLLFYNKYILKDSLDFQYIERIVPEFILGILFYKFYKVNNLNWNTIVVSLLIIVILLIVLSFSVFQKNYEFLVFPIALTIIALLLSNNKYIQMFFSNSWVVRGGEISYSMYMVQYIAIFLTQFVCSYLVNHNFISEGIRSNVIKLFLVIFLDIVIAILTFKFVENKFLKYSSFNKSTIRKNVLPLSPKRKVDIQ